MNRKYTREWYLGRIAAIRRYLPDCAITTDLIAGFSGETEQEHEATLSLMREVGTSSPTCSNTRSVRDFRARAPADDVPDEVKSRRLSEIIALQNELGMRATCATWGASSKCWSRARRSATKSSSRAHVAEQGRGLRPRRHDVGDYVRVRITGCTPATLFGEEII